MSNIKVIISILLAATAGLCCNGPARAQSRLVFAHYMVANVDYGRSVGGDPVLGYMKEIRQAQAIGIDGFALNCGGWSREPYYRERADQIFAAAARLHTGFRLFFSADMCCGLTAADIVDMMRRYVNNPATAGVYFRYHDRPVLSTFAGQDEAGGGAAAGDWWANNVLTPLNRGEPGNRATDVYFVPMFFPEPAANQEIPTRAEVFDAPRSSFNAWWGSVADGLFYWGLAGLPVSDGPLSSLRASEAYADAAHRNGKTYMAPCVLQFWGMNARGRRYFEYSGGEGLRRQWMNIINVAKPEWVEIATWNDFNEATYVSPIDDPNRYPGNYLAKTRTGFYKSHVGAYHLLRYYIEWYKRAAQPKVARDSIYWFYRTHPKDAAALGDTPVTERHGPVSDVLYVTADLKKPARLKVSSGAHIQWIWLPAGSSDVETPFRPGAQSFELWRNGRRVLKARGEAIEAQPVECNFIYSTGWAQETEPLR